jgi:antitoxin (DNA-binding transcriptional repressor) of toxin-antitoxin stability system
MERPMAIRPATVMRKDRTMGSARRRMVMRTVTLEEAQAHLSRLIEQLMPGDEVVITRDHEPVARLVAANRPSRRPRRLGTMRGSVLRVAPDFDAPLEDFKEYME